MDRNIIIFSAVIIYLLICIIVGIWAMKKTKSSHDFFMAGRDLGIMVTAFAVFSSTLSGFGFVGGPGLVYRMGMSSVWMVVAAAIGYSISFWLLGKRIRLLGELRNAVSLPDVVATRYGSESTRFFTALAIILGVLGYLATQILAMGVVLQDILNDTTFFDNVTLTQTLIVSCTILAFYTVAGGIVASVYTDLIQGAMMIVAAVLVFYTVVTTYDGGMFGISEAIKADDPEAIGPWGTLGMVGCMSWLFVFGLGGAGQPHVITKMMMNKKVSDAKNILPVTLGGYVFSALLWIGIGLIMRALVVSGQHPELASADSAAAQFLTHYAHPLLAGVVFAGLFAAIMSTADGFLSIGTAAFVHDIPKAISGKILNNELFWARVVTVVLSIAATIFAYFANQSGDLVAILGAFGWGTFAAALVPVVAIGFSWKRASALAANVAIIASLVTNFTLKIFVGAIPFGMDPGAISLVVSMTLFFGISLYMNPKPLDKDVEAIMDM